MAIWKRLARTCPLGLFVIALGVNTASSESVTSSTRKVIQLAEGVYTIRHPDPTDDFPDGNTTVIIGEKDVLVVDTCYLPSSARMDIAQISQWTGMPVRYVLNTHWHNDHNGGNAAYLEAYPMAAIVAHDETRAMMMARIPSYVRRFTAADSVFGKQRAALAAVVATATDASGKALSPAEVAEAAHNLALTERAVAPFMPSSFTLRPAASSSCPVDDPSMTASRRAPAGFA